jgi:hypothetical protein
MFFSDGGTDIREVQLYLNPEAEHYQVTQLHNYLPSPAGKRFLLLRQELSNSGARIFAVGRKNLTERPFKSGPRAERGHLSGGLKGSRLRTSFFPSERLCQPTAHCALTCAWACLS